jgi:hypothetical protein
MLVHLNRANDSKYALPVLLGFITRQRPTANDRLYLPEGIGT